ncbi:hypothetical protein [Undibacterium sp. TS12]|uniref:hypothetical protein n=1 Tax=Undibacterium sp. TS12 TaxID=2908202 RepID=UPI001F4C985A|nr:hypothetical protein [Undibacterium sp. TS12]MCH8622508.1 hypothetical protein [Undibacterium sp. TS12]
MNPVANGGTRAGVSARHIDALALPCKSVADARRLPYLCRKRLLTSKPGGKAAGQQGQRRRCDSNW